MSEEGSVKGGGVIYGELDLATDEDIKMRYRQEEEDGEGGRRDHFQQDFENDRLSLDEVPLILNPKDVAVGRTWFFLIGLTPFFLQNSFLAEVAYFVENTPEGKAIGLNITAAFVLGNFISICYSAFQPKARLSDRQVLVVLNAMAILVCIFAAIFWEATWGSKRSWPLLFLALLAGGIGNLSTLTLFAFVSSYTDQMTYAANLGAGFSGLLAGFFVVLQRPSDPNFSAFWYFFMIGEIVTVGLIALLYGAWSQTASRLRVYIMDELDLVEKKERKGFRVPVIHQSLIKEGVLPLFYMLWMSTMAYLIPPLVPYLARNDTANMIAYLYTIYLVALPCGSISASFVDLHRFAWLSSLVQTFFAIYLVLSCLNATMGDIYLPYWLCYLAVFMTSFIMGYNTTLVYLYIRKKYPDPQDSSTLSLFAAVTSQMGALLGVLTQALLIGFHLYDLGS